MIKVRSKVIKNLIFGGLIFLLLVGCAEEEKKLMTGPWHLDLEVSNSKKLPVELAISKIDSTYSMKIFNADEVIEVDEIWVEGDSIIIRMPVFEGYIAGTHDGDQINGDFIKESLDRVVPVKAVMGERPRFNTTSSPKYDVSGIWETIFIEKDGSTYPAKGIFEQDEDQLTGTFRTTTGDYRYLEGVVDGDSLRLSTFDGAHAFLFEAEIRTDSMTGVFYSGNHSVENFKARRNADYELTEPDSLTFLKPGYDKITFSFPDKDGNLISLDDPQFQDKVVIVQIMGTWCPNCLDESKFLALYLKENTNDDLEVIALAFEYAKTPEAAFRGIDRLRARLGLDYPILLAQYGSSSKSLANEKLPMLNHVLSYPTTIFIDKKGKVRKIHTGFNGPATGEKYEEFKVDFNQTVNQLLEE